MKKKLYILTVIFLLITIFTVSSTYSLFETNATADATFKVGKWIIKLNNKDISLDKIITLNDFNIINSTHTEQNYFAPGSIAEYEIDIDVSESDVSVEYEIDIDDSKLEEYPNINIKILDLDEDIEMHSNKTSGVIALDNESKTKKLKIILEWENIEEYDESDTSLIDGVLSFNIKVNFKQYLKG